MTDCLAQTEACERVVDARLWCDGMLKQPPQPHMLALEKMLTCKLAFEYMVEHTDVLRDLVSLLPSTERIVMHVIMSLLSDISSNAYMRIAAQLSDHGLLNTLWSKCVDAMPSDVFRSTWIEERVVLELLKRVDDSWQPPVHRLLATAIGVLKSHRNMPYTFTYYLNIVLEVLKHTKHADVLDICLEADLFTFLHVCATDQASASAAFDASTFTWLPPFIKHQFYYNMRCLAIALHQLDLPVLQLLAVIDATLPNTEPMHAKWRVLAHTKHFRPAVD